MVKRAHILHILAQCIAYAIRREGESIGWSPREEVYSNDGAIVVRIGIEGGIVDKTSNGSPSVEGRGKVFQFYSE
jgi:hypothetical protein